MGKTSCILSDLYDKKKERESNNKKILFLLEL